MMAMLGMLTVSDGDNWRLHDLPEFAADLVVAGGGGGRRRRRRRWWWW